jgi:FkbM family methyltransferase
MKPNSTIAPAPLKQVAQAFLKQIGLYQRLRSSCIYDFYWTFANPQWIANRTGEIKFYRAALEGFQRGNVIFDIGANDGCKTDIFLRLGAKVIAVEPDEINQDVIKGKFVKNRFFPKPVIIVGNAVSDGVGVMTMWIDAPGSALNTLNPKWVETLRNDETHAGKRLCFAEEKIVETTTLEKLIASHGIPFYIKIDVEGHELNILRGLKQPVPYLSFEVNLPEFKEEGLECIRILAEIAADGEFNYVADYDEGLMFKQWMPTMEFIHAFGQCKKSAIEVFWRLIR